MSIIPRRSLSDGWQATAYLGKSGAMRYAASRDADGGPPTTVEVAPGDPWSPEIGLIDAAWRVYVPRPVGAEVAPPPPWARDLLPGARLALLATCGSRDDALDAALDWLARVDSPS